MPNNTHTQSAPVATERAHTPPGLRERKKEQKRERLTQAAFDLFTERGFDDVTVEEIAERAEVSKSTLFRYFDTKEDLLLVGARMHRDALLSALSDRPTDEPVLTSLRSALQSMAVDYQADRAVAIQRNRIIAESPALGARSLERQAAWEDGLAAGILPRLAGSADAETRAAVLAAAAMAVVRVATRRWIAADDDTEMIDHVLAALDLLIDELEPPRRRVRIRKHGGDR